MEKANHGKAIQVAITGRILEVIKLLLEAEPMLDVNTIGLTPEGDGTPLVIAIELKADDIIELLLANGADVHVAPVFRGPPLALAAKVGSLSITKLLLRAGADPNRFNPKTGLSPLKGAVISRSIPIMQLMLDHGANVNAKDRNDDDDFAEPPLEAAVRRNLLAEAEFLLETGRASIEIVGKASNQLIHRAARKGSVEMMALLLAHGADVNGRNKLRSPIYHAALSGHLSTVEWLVEKGADPCSISPKQQQSCVENAERRKDEGLLAFLQALKDEQHLAYDIQIH